MFEILHNASGFSQVIMNYAEEIKGVANFADFSKLKVRKVNRTTHLWVGEMTFLGDVGDEFMV